MPSSIFNLCKCFTLSASNLSNLVLSHKLKSFFILTPKPFSYIGHNGNRYPSYLIYKAEIFRKGILTGKGVNSIGNFSGQFPDFQIFKVSNSYF